MLRRSHDSPVGRPATRATSHAADAVLNNIEYAWNYRSGFIIEELLDADFLFYLSAADVAGGTPDSWDRATELLTTSRLMDKNYTGGNSLRSVHVDLDLDGLTWVEVPVPASSSTRAEETWYTATVPVTFTFEFEPDLTLQSGPHYKAQFTVREVPDGDATKWQLVEWRDLGPTAPAIDTPEAKRLIEFARSRFPRS